MSGAPTVHNATLTIQKNGTSAGTFTANASANKTINITVPTQTSDLDNDSGFITSANLPVATANTLGGVKSGGDITVASTGAVTVSHATKADTATKATQDASGNVITSTYATKTEVGSKLSSISGSTSGTGNVVTTVSASGSTVSATKGITAEETKNKVKSVRAAASATDTAYPSEKAVATALAAKADKSELSGYATNTRVDAVEDKAEAAQTAASAAQSTATAAQTAANAKVATAQGSGAANKAVITNSSGNITTGQIATGMIANDAVTSAKLAAGAVDATALASDAVTSAKIADGTIVNADISASAAIAASKISGLATVATTGSYNDLANKPTIPAAYVLKAATANTLGGVKSGGDITVASTGAVTVNSATKATQDASGNVITSTYAKKTELPTVNNATLTIQKNGTSAGTFTANASANKTINITVPTKTSELTNDSNYATTAQVNARVATAQGTDNANDVMVVNSSGNVTPALITNANISSSAAIAQSKISGLTTALAEKLSTTGTAAKATADAKGNNIADTYATKSQINALDSTSTGTGAVVTSVSQTDGKVSVTKGNVQIPVGSPTATSYATIWVQ